MVRPLDLRATAIPANVGMLRRALRRWLSDVVDDPDLVDDLTLAASEAFENATDHAFTGRTEPGTMTLVAELDPPHVIVIRIEDDGVWQAPSAEKSARGRGLVMMETLAESAVVEIRAAGTAVTLTQSLAHGLSRT